MGKMIQQTGSAGAEAALQGVRWKVCGPRAAQRGDGQWSVASVGLSLPEVCLSDVRLMA